MSRAKGNIAEETAAVYLQERGFEIMERNYTLRGGEIDIIALKEGVLHFIEVKSGNSYSPLYNITPKKLALVVRTAQRFMQKKGLNIPFQIDALSVSSLQCELVENITL